MSSSPVMAPLANARVAELAAAPGASARETVAASIVNARLNLPVRNGDKAAWPLFEAWTKTKQLPALPARPATVAFFVLDQAALGIARLLAVVESVSAMHEGAADPTLSPVVAAALTKVESVPVPRSWPRAAAAQFLALPRSLQTYIAAREAERDREIRRAQNEAGAARHELKQQLKEKTNHGETVAA